MTRPATGLTFCTRPNPDPEDEGEFHCLALRDGVPIARAKFDEHETYLLVLMVAVDEAYQRQGIATALLTHLSTTYNRRLLVEDHTPDGRQLFQGRYHWDGDHPT